MSQLFETMTLHRVSVGALNRADVKQNRMAWHPKEDD